MSVDVFADVVDYQRGAKEVVELMVAAAKKMKGEEWREEFGKLRKAMFGAKRRSLK